MELQDFITNVLVSIVEGVQNAKHSLNKNGGHVCPAMGAAFATKFEAKLDTFEGIYYQETEFDVAVTVENKSDGGAKASVKVFGIEGSLGGNLAEKSSTVSRIKFRVPLGLPVKSKASS